MQAGKSQWVVKRDGTVFAKGKGELTTYWLHAWNGSNTGSSAGSVSDMNSRDGNLDVDETDLKTDSAVSKQITSLRDSVVNSNQTDRLVQWNVDILKRFLKQIIAYRVDSGVQVSSAAALYSMETKDLRETVNCGSILDLAKEVIPVSMPKRERSVVNGTNPSTIELGEKVESQLLSYIRAVSTMYRDNPFHNFEVCKVRDIIQLRRI